MGIFKKIKPEDKIIVREGLERIVNVGINNKSIKPLLKKHLKNNYDDLKKVDLKDINSASIFSEDDFPEINLPLQKYINVNEIWNIQKNSYKVALRVSGPYSIQIDVSMEQRKKIAKKVAEEEGNRILEVLTRELKSSNKYNIYNFIGKPGVPDTVGIITWEPDINSFDEGSGFCKTVDFEDIYVIE